MLRVSIIFLTAAVAVSTAVAQDLSDKFYESIRAGDTAAVKQLLAHGANVNTRDKRGTTPLMQAAAFGSIEAMKILIAAGADVNAKNAFEATALMWAVYDLDRTQLLIDKGADVNAKSKMGRTPLLIACVYAGNAEVVKLLLSKGADINARDAMGNVAITEAADREMTRVLLNAGADAKAKGGGGFTPLHVAAAHGDIEWVKMLLAKGADVNAVADPSIPPGVKNGPIALGSFTPLLMAVAYGSPELIKVLVDAGAGVNARDVRGMTPLMLAIGCDHNDPRTVRALLYFGADPKIKSKEGEDAYTWAKKVGSAEVIRMLGMTASTPRPAVLAVDSSKPPDAATAVQKSVGLMQKTTSKFLVEGGCAACHSHNITGMAVAEAQPKGVRIDETAAAEQLKATVFGWSGFEQPLLQRVDPPGGIDMLDYALMQMAAGKHPADRTTDAMIFNAAALQGTNGAWHFGAVARPPIEDGDFARTALAIRIFQLYGFGGRKAEFDGRVARAKDWLLEAKPATSEDRNMRLLGLKWADAPAAAVQRATRDVLGAQRQDGGWSQTADLASDAYATGQALYALHSAGVPAIDPAYQRGVTFLLRTQLSDGSWHVASRAPKFQPYFQSGFPHDHDQWISSMATGWSIMALSPAIGSKQVAAVH